MRIFVAAALALLASGAVAGPLPTIPSTAEQPGQADVARVVAGTYAVDPHHTQVAWTVNHLGVSMLNGLWGAREGTLVIDPAQLGQAKVDVTFAVADLAVTSLPFGEHLRSDDFFDAANHSTARFVSTRVTPGENGHATIDGELTLRGTTRPVTVEAVFVGAGTNPRDEKLNAGFRGTGTIRRSDFGLGDYVPAVSDEVALTIEAAFVK